MRIFRPNFALTVSTVSIVFVSVILSCQNSDKKVSVQESNEYKEIKATKVTINFNQSFVIKEIKSGETMSDIFVSGTGFPNSNNILTFAKTAPLETFLVADLDENGFEELYLITRSVGSGSKAYIIGIASMDGKSYKTIFNPENENTIKEKRDYFEGYQGHDSIFIKSNKLYRQFPVYNGEFDKTKTELKNIRIIRYRLVLYNNNYSLQVEGISNNSTSI